MKKSDLPIYLGSTLILASIFVSVFLKFHYWFSFFSFGMFLLFGGLNHRAKAPSIYSYIAEGKWRGFIVIYFSIAFVFGLIVDTFFGRIVSDVWIYPYLSGVYSYLVPIFVYYPLGGFQVYETFYFFKDYLKRFNCNKLALGDKIKDSLITLILVLMILSAIMVVLALAFGFGTFRNSLMFIALGLSIFSFDAIIYKIKKESILLDALQGNPAVIMTMFASWLVNLVLTEIPNTFSWEWRYQNIPFTQLEFLKINILVITFGYFFLVFTIVRSIDMMKMLSRIKN